MVEPRIGFWWWWATWAERLPFLARHVLGERSPAERVGLGARLSLGFKRGCPLLFSFFFFF